MTRALTNTDYVKREERRQIDQIHPHIHTELLQSEAVYNDYLKQIAEEAEALNPKSKKSKKGKDKDKDRE